MPILKTESIFRQLGIITPVPLTCEEMAKSLIITVYPMYMSTPRLDCFVADMLISLAEKGARVVAWEDVTEMNKGRRVVPNGVTVFAPGICPDGVNLAIQHVASLHGTTIIGLYDKACPVCECDSAQAKLDACATAAAQHLVQVQIYVEDEDWTLLSMNGGVVRQSRKDMAHSILNVLVPKIAARVVPPRMADLKLEAGGFNPLESWLRPILDDFVTCGRIWAGDQSYVCPYPSQFSFLPLCSSPSNRFRLS
jgi:hypothetical protein